MEGWGGDIRDEPRGGHTLARYQIGGVSVRMSFGHLDRMPRCRKCDRALCSHSDAEFKGQPA